MQMPDNCRCLIASVLACAAVAMPAASRAQQKSTENAVTSADDAFGTSVGLESTGIYSQHNVRGFSPLDAGNARIDGIYFDPVSLITLRARASQTSGGKRSSHSRKLRLEISVFSRRSISS